MGYAVFGTALVYFATQVFQKTGASVIQGWYLTLFVPVEAVLFVAGARGWFERRWNWIVSALVVLFFALLIYSAVFVALPYYAGVTSHNPSGHLETYHPAFDDLSLMTHRLLRFQPAVPAFVPWVFWCVVGGFCVYSLYSRDTP